MSQQAVVSDTREIGGRQVDPHRLAWGVLLLAFAIFCIIAVTAIIGIDYFLFQSAVPMRSVLSPGRGTVRIAELANSNPQAARNNEVLVNGMIISTDNQSQGMIRITDPQAQENLMAAVTLHNSSSLMLRQAARPRFEWSRTRHIVDLSAVSGRLSISIPDDEGDNVLVNIETAGGAIINLEGTGRYTINTSDEQLSIINFAGTATLIPPDRVQGHSIPVGRIGILNYEDNGVEQRAGYVNLLTDSQFKTLSSGAQLSSWVCGNDPNDSPAGAFEFVPVDGRMVLRFIRADEATTHGRTSCVQSFGQTGIDLAANQYNYLAVRATLFIEYQSLNACGVDGSECPLMMRMDYIGLDGDNQKGERWFHGFYAFEADAQSNYRLRCASCLQDHDLINKGAWFTYESPNLLTLLAETSPQSIVGIVFYASGHQWDVRVDEVMLVGAHLDNVDVTPSLDEVVPESG